MKYKLYIDRSVSCKKLIKSEAITRGVALAPLKNGDLVFESDEYAEYWEARNTVASIVYNLCCSDCIFETDNYRNPFDNIRFKKGAGRSYCK